MSVSASVQVVGVKDTLKQLRELDPELRKQFSRDVKQIVKPLTDEAKILYSRSMPSGFNRQWNVGQRQIFPWQASKAKTGVTVKISTSQRSRSVISVKQNNPAAAIIEFAGTKNYNNFAAQTSLRFGRTRGKVMWQAADRKLSDITGEVELAVQAGSNTVQKKLQDLKSWRT
jgi:hypothetical protein